MVYGSVVEPFNISYYFPWGYFIHYQCIEQSVGGVGHGHLPHAVAVILANADGYGKNVFFYGGIVGLYGDFLCFVRE